jgi:hypothetical protein
MLTTLAGAWPGLTDLSLAECRRWGEGGGGDGPPRALRPPCPTLRSLYALLRVRPMIEALELPPSITSAAADLAALRADPGAPAQVRADQLQRLIANDSDGAELRDAKAVAASLSRRSIRRQQFFYA